MERLDKVLSNSGVGTRKEVKALIKKGRVKVNGNPILDEALKVNPNCDIFMIDDEIIKYKKYIYLLLNKPAGVVSATEDNYDKTVIDLLSEEDKAFLPYPVGRLDKDTLGLLILTNNGDLNHRLISPKWHVNKTYRAILESEILDDYEDKIKEGIVIDDGYKCLPGEFKVINRDKKEINLTIREGKFHQVKRMFEALNNKVIFLERISFGPITLDEKLLRGEYRHLDDKEVIKLLKATNLEKEK